MMRRHHCVDAALAAQSRQILRSDASIPKYMFSARGLCIMKVRKKNQNFYTLAVRSLYTHISIAYTLNMMSTSVDPLPDRMSICTAPKMSHCELQYPLRLATSLCSSLSLLYSDRLRYPSWPFGPPSWPFYLPLS
jgi:hypothetical protein